MKISRIVVSIVNKMKLFLVTTAIVVGAGTAYIAYLRWNKVISKYSQFVPIDGEKYEDFRNLIVYPLKSLAMRPVTEYNKLDQKSGWCRHGNLLVVDLKGHSLTVHMPLKIIQVCDLLFHLFFYQKYYGMKN